MGSKTEPEIGGHVWAPTIGANTRPHFRVLFWIGVDNNGDFANDDNDDADGDDEFSLHLGMCGHECTLHALYLPSWTANWTAILGSTMGQQTGLV